MTPNCCSVLLLPEELDALEEARTLLPDDHPLRGTLGTRLIRARASLLAGQHWESMQARLELLSSVLKEVTPDALAGLPCTVTLASDDDRASWAGFLRRLSAAQAPLTGPSVQAYVQELERQLLVLRLQPPPAPAIMDVSRPLAILEESVKAAHEYLASRGVPYHPNLVERIKSALPS